MNRRPFAPEHDARHIPAGRTGLGTWTAGMRLSF